MKTRKRICFACVAALFNGLVTLLSILWTQLSLFAQASTEYGNKQNCYYIEDIFARVSDHQEATLAFYETLENLNRPLKDNEKILTCLYADIIDIMRPTELEQWKGLKTTEEKIAFLKRFWRSRDLTPATETNERLVEHYTRLAYARDRYTFPSSRGYDDRGQIYVQYGPPDDFVIDTIPPSSLPSEAWVYHRLGMPVIFEFIDRGYGYHLATRFDESIMAIGPSARFAAIGALLNKRATLNTEYNAELAQFAGLLNDLKLRLISINEALRRIEFTIAQDASENYNVQKNLPETNTDILKNIIDLPFSVHFARFKEDAQHHFFAIVYGLNASELKFDKGDSTARIVMAAAIKDTNLVTIAGQQDTLHLTATSFDNIGRLTRTLQYKISSGRYFVLFDLDNPANRQRGLKDFSLVVGNYPTGSLHLSSVVLAKKVAPADSATEQHAFTRHHLAIVPYPFPALQRGAPMFVYFEVYDLQHDVSGETFYEVEYEVHEPAKKGFASLLASLNPFGKSGGSISVAETRRGKAAVEPTYLQLDFSQLRSGKYDLIVRVTDKVANATKESKLEFELE